MNQPTNFGGWDYQFGATYRQDSQHNAEITDSLFPWLGSAPANTQLAAGIVTPGDTNAGAPPAPENMYVGGAVRLLKHPECASYIDKLVGRVAASIDFTSTNTGAQATSAMNCLAVHRMGLTL
jgi:hypothetical protein